MMLAGPDTTDQVMGFLWLLAFALIVLAVYAKDRKRAPFVPCRRCGGGGARSWFRASARGVCPKCGGKPSRRRF